MSKDNLGKDDVKESPMQIIAWVIGIMAATGGAALLVT